MQDKIIIFGASGLIGSYLYDLLNKKYPEKIIGTYNTNPREKLIYFNMVNPEINEDILEEVKYAIVCSAVTKIDRCKDNPDYSNQVNVLGVKKLLLKLKEKNIVPIFLSSASVFDGIMGDYSEGDLKNPVTLYGKQKAEIEDFILSNFEEYIIIRPGKVFGLKKGEGVLFSEWLEKYKNEEEIKCADDEKLSPHYVKDVARGIFSLIEIEARGIYNMNPPEYFSRFEMINDFFDFFEIYDAKIIRCSINDFDFSDKRPQNTYLNASKFIEQTNFKFTNLHECYNKIYGENNKTYIALKSSSKMESNVYDTSKLGFHKDKIKSISSSKVTAPIYVRVKPTNKCNHGCYYCSYAIDSECPVSETINMIDEIPRDKILEILDDFKKMGVKAITFSGGGEPLIYPHIIESINKCIENGIDLSIITNGQELKGKKAEVLKDAKWVRISLDSSNPVLFSKTRRRPESWFYELEENIKNFVKIKNSDCEFGINFVVQEKNANEVYSAVKYFKNLGVNHIKITPVYVPNFLEYHESLRDKVEEQIKKAREEFEGDGFTVYDTYKNDFELTGLDYRTYPRCYIMQIIPVIGADSVVYFCHDKTYSKNGAIGSIKNKSFRELWFSDKTAEIFKNFNPQESCKHHCTYDSRNLMVQEMLRDIDKVIESHKPQSERHKNFI